MKTGMVSISHIYKILGVASQSDFVVKWYNTIPAAKEAKHSKATTTLIMIDFFFISSDVKLIMNLI